jgi:hypothetical protein
MTPNDIEIQTPVAIRLVPAGTGHATVSWIVPE